PMLDHVRVHPELVTGTQDYELDPSRWRYYEVHDIMIECSRVSLDPLESSCEEDMYLSLRDPHLDLTSSPQNTETVSSSGLFLSECLPHLTTLNNSYIQADEVTWSPSSQCGLSTPPPEPSAPPLNRTTSISGVTSPSSSAVPAAPPTEGNQDGGVTPQVKLVTEPEGSSIQPITEQEGGGHSDVIDDISGDVSSQQPVLLTSTPSPGSAPPSVLCFTPPHSSRSEEGGSAPSAQSPAPSYGPLFELALPRAATLLIGRMTQEAMERTAGEQETAGGGRGGRSAGGGGEGEGEDREEEQTSVSPLEVLDQLIVHGHDAHQHISRRWSAVSRGDRSLSGGKHQSMKTKEGEELQSLRSQLLLVHSQLQYERFRRQQHAVRNRRLLRRVINATTLEESSVAMKGQLEVQDEEIRSLRTSLQEEHRRYSHLQQDTHTHTNQLHTHTQQLLLQHLEEQRDRQRLEVELQECQSRLRELEAELQRANNKAYNAEHQLTQLSLKLCSSEQLQQQMFLMNQQLVLLRETNRTLREHLEHLEGGESQHTVASMLQCTLGNEFQQLKDSDVQQRQKLEAANHRTAELETQLAKRDQLILDQKKLLEDTKTQSRGELTACESRCVALRRVAQTLQTETLHLYSRIHLDAPQDARPHGGGASPAPHGGHKPRPPSSSSSVGLINGGVQTLSSSPLHLLSCSSSPIDSPLAVGSFLEQRARQLFRPTNHSQEEEAEEEQQEEEQQEEEEAEEEQQEEAEEEQEEAQPESPPLGQEAELLLTGSPQEVWASGPSWTPSGPPAPPADLTLAVRQRRHELSIMDYDETLPEY
ncbi:hamartin-like, partial [Sebastes fasciatus]|uniref:hamartin-like n=1 Tax=Sebastes fasciatus TaxID=394691 RepID=UPI003D9F5B5A